MRLLLAIVLALFPVVATAATDVEFLLDLSGSMMKRIDGVPQIDLAKKSFREALAVIPPDELVAVRVFAHRIEQTNKTASCTDTELVYPFAKTDLTAIERAIATLQPKGYTPLAYSLEKSGEDLIAVGKEREPNRVIVVLSDGEETCGGDPIAVLKQLKEKGVNVIVHTIGFNVDDVARKQLQEIAAFSGGKYFDAKDGTRLSESLQLATKEAFVAQPTPIPTITPEARLDKPRELMEGKPVRGGNGYSSAVPITDLGVQLKLDHRQFGNDLDYFYLDLNPGDLVHGMIRTGHMAMIDDRELYGHAGGKIAIHGPDKTEIVRSFASTQSTNAKVEEDFFVAKKGRYYFLVGNYGNDIHKDHFFFTLSVTKKGDLDTEVDAGDTDETALPIMPGTYTQNFGGLADKEDRFRLEAKKGEKYKFTMIPQGEKSPGASFEVRDALKIRLSSSTRGGGTDQGLEANFSAPEDGDLFLIVSYHNNQYYSNYTIKLSKVE